MEEKQLFLQRNQELFEKVQFTLDFTFMDPGAVVVSESSIHCQVAPAQGLASTFCFDKVFHPEFVCKPFHLIGICPNCRLS